MNIILQHYNGTLGELENLSVENIKEYAARLGVQYELIRGKPFREHLTSPCQKVFMLDRRFDEYDDVLMLDIDMFAVKGLTKNVFDENGIGLYEQTQKGLHDRLASKFSSIANINIPYWGGAIYKFNKEARIQLRQALGKDEAWMNHFNKAYRYEDEGIMHVLANKTNFNPESPYLDKKWCQSSFFPDPENAFIIHIRTKITPKGPKRTKIENYYDLRDKGII